MFNPHHTIHRSAFASVAILACSHLASAGVPDFNGDGRSDLALGVPSEDIGAANSGAVAVLYGGTNGLKSGGNQFWHQDNLSADDGAEANNEFGSALAWGDFNGDGFSDLAIGIQGEDVGAILDAGAVYVIYGSSTGLTNTSGQFWSQGSAGLLDSAEANDSFGEALASGDFDGDGFADLAIGIPGEGVGALSSAGAVAILYGSASGLVTAGNQFWHQNSGTIVDAAEASDEFGDSLAAGDFDGDGRDDLAVGVDDEDVGTKNAAGAVHIIYGSASGLADSGNQMWDLNLFSPSDTAEDNDNFGDALAAADFDNDGFDDLAISVDLKDANARIDSGVVVVLYGSAAGIAAAGKQMWSQNAAGIADNAEAGDRFGSSLRAGDFDNDGFFDLAIGVEDEDVGTRVDAGAVHVIYGSGSGLNAAGSKLWHQNTAGVIDSAENGDHFGDALSTGDYNNDGFDDLAVGVEHEDFATINDGAVNVLFGSGSGIASGGNQFWHQDSTGIKDKCEVNDEFSSVL